MNLDQKQGSSRALE